VTLQARVDVQVGDFRLSLDLTAEAGETVAVLGPNGAGKSTLLRCLAGLHRIDRGRVTLGGTTLDDPETGTFITPQDRGIGVVFQDHLLFPAMSVGDNVAFGLRCRRVPRPEARRRAVELLGAVGLADRVTARPGDLSGGQSQRVALARALAIGPTMLLLDEPLAALDVTTRASIRRELRAQLDPLRDCVRLLVSHDPVDAFALADRVVVIENGRVSQFGSLADVAARPNTRYVADLVGVNLYAGHARGADIELDGGFHITAAEPTTGPVFVVIHPRAVSLLVTEPNGSPRNVWPGRITDIDLERDRARVRVAGVVPITAEITSIAAAEMRLRPGDHVWVSVKATETATHRREEVERAT
jgi:molybdate transport system ATP-binding protein